MSLSRKLVLSAEIIAICAFSLFGLLAIRRELDDRETRSLISSFIPYKVKKGDTLSGLYMTEARSAGKLRSLSLSKYLVLTELQNLSKKEISPGVFTSKLNSWGMIYPGQYFMIMDLNHDGKIGK